MQIRLKRTWEVEGCFTVVLVAKPHGAFKLIKRLGLLETCHRELPLHLLAARLRWAAHRPTLRLRASCRFFWPESQEGSR